jgi:hypothetical protein
MNGIEPVKIERGIPRERVASRSGRNGFYPYFEMKKGDSFLCPNDLKPSSCYGIAREGNKRAILALKPHRFTASKTADGFRVWRVA